MGLENTSMLRKGNLTPMSAAPTSTVASSHILQEAEYHWNMAKQMGVSCGTNHESIIDMILAMENRDRKEAEKLGNRSVPHEHFNI